MTRWAIIALFLLALVVARDEKGERTSWQNDYPAASVVTEKPTMSSLTVSTIPSALNITETYRTLSTAPSNGSSTHGLASVAAESAPAATAPSAPTPDAPEAEHAHPEALYVWSLTEPAAEMPTAMAETAYSVIQCESKHNTLAVGSQGERGVFQIHPIHQKRMASLGLDFDVEADRIAFAVIKWSESESFSAWSCSH